LVDSVRVSLPVSLWRRRVERYSYTPAFVLFALLPMLCVFVLWYVMGPIEGHRSGSWPLAPPQA